MIDPEIERLKQDIKQLRLSLARAIEERNTETVRAKAYKAKVQNAEAIVSILLKRAGGAVTIERKHLAAKRGIVQVNQTKTGIRLNLIKKGK